MKYDYDYFYDFSHETELTQWDHPIMVKVIGELSNFNQIKFCAYRTAMKLRALQKRLCCKFFISVIFLF